VVRYDRTIPPGGVGQVTLQVNTTGLQGKITKSAQVTTNDPKQRKSKIYLVINVRTYIIVKPGTKILLRGTVGEDIRRVVHIRASDDQPLEITKVQSNLGSAIDYKLNRKDDGHQYELEVVSKATDKKTASGYITLHTNHPKKKVVKLSVHVRIRPELEARPNQIAFQKTSKSGNPKGGFKRVITIVNNRGKSFRLRELRYNQEYFKVRSLAPSGKSQRRHQLEVIPLMDRLPAGRVRFEETLVIKTDVAKAAELKVRMRIQVETEK
jgi:hypothetical protein